VVHIVFYALLTQCQVITFEEIMDPPQPLTPNEDALSDPFITFEWTQTNQTDHAITAFEIWVTLNSTDQLLATVPIESALFDPETEIWSYQLTEALPLQENCGDSIQWWIRARNEFQYFKGDAIGTFHLYNGSSPVVLEPTQDAVVCTQEFQLMWEPLTCYSTYNLTIATAESMDSASIVLTTTIQDTTYSLDSTILESNQDYYWQIQGYHSEFSSAVNTVHHFTFAYLETPTELLPADASRFLNPTPTLSWTSNYEAIPFTIELATESSFEETTMLDGFPVVAHEDTTFTLSTPLEPGTYYWRIQAVKVCESAMTPTNSFTVLPFISITSPCGTICNTSYEFSWNSSEGNTYEYQLSTDGTYEDGTPQVAATTSYNADSLTSDTYYFRVRATELDYNTPWSTCELIVDTSIIPSVPLNLDANGGSNCTGESITLTWDPPSSGTVTDYTLQHTASGAEVSIGTVTSTTLSGVSDGDVVYIRGYNETCAGPSASDTIAISSVAIPQLDEVGACEGEDVTLSWNDLGVTSYDVEWDDQTDFSSPLNSVNVTTNSTVVSGLSVGTYYYRVRANENGCSSDWSNTTNYSFELTALPSNPTGLLDPSDGFVNTQFDFQWDPVSGMTYSVQYDFDPYNSWMDASNINDVAGTANATITSTGTYKFQVRATDAQGCSSGWTTLSDTFEVNPVGSCPDRFFVGTNANGVYYTTDGTTFTQHADVPLNCLVRDIMRHGYCDIWISCYSGSHQVYASFDGGISFAQMTTFPKSEAYQACWFDNKVWVALGGEYGAYYTDDNGTTWKNDFACSTGVCIEDRKNYGCFADFENDRIYFVGSGGSSRPSVIHSSTSPYQSNFAYYDPDRFNYRAYAYFVSSSSNTKYPNTHFIGYFDYAFDYLPETDFPCRPDGGGGGAYPDPCYYYGDIQETVHVVEDFTEFNDYVWAAGSQGIGALLRLDTAGTTSTPAGWTGGSTYSVANWGGKLWAGTYNGLYSSPDGVTFTKNSDIPDDMMRGMQHQDGW